MARRFIDPPLAALAALFIASVAAPAVAAADARNAVGTVSLVVGEARVVSADGAKHSIRRGITVRPGDRVETALGGHVHIRFIDDALVSVRPSSRLVIEEYQYDPARVAESQVRFRLETGVARAISGAAADGRLHLPYTRYRALSPAGPLAVYARGVDPMDAPVEDESRRPIGGVWVIRADAWWAAGGMDEDFKGWGFEDDSFFTAANVLLGETVRHEGTITHLHHTPAANTRSPEYRTNRAHYQQYVRARRSPEAMRRLVGLPSRRRIAVLAHYCVTGLKET